MNRLVLIAAFCGLLTSSALAQSQPDAARPSGIPDAEKLQKSAEAIDKMKASMKSVLARVDEARNEKDVVKLNCVNEKLTQIKGLLKVAEQSDIALHEAIANKDAAAESEFAKVGIAGSKVEGLKTEADQCIGQLAYIVDEKTTVEVQQDPSLSGSEGAGAAAGIGTRSGQTAPPSAPVVRPRPASSYLP